MYIIPLKNTTEIQMDPQYIDTIPELLDEY